MANSSSSSRRPTITLPPKPTLEHLFNPAGGPAGFSPGPMTLLSSFLDTPSNDGSGWSFSQLLAGAIASSPHVNSSASATQFENSPSVFKIEEVKEENCSNIIDSSNSEGYRGNRPTSLTISSSPMFVIPSGLTPSGLLISPALFSPGQMSPFGMSHQQALAQVTAQAALAQSQVQMSGYQTSFAESSEALENNYPGTTNVNTHQHMPPLTSEITMESSDVSNSDRKIQPTSLTIDKPADDGYNWRKYGQKQVKGSEYPRSYYKCTHLTCPVKKKVERSIEGQVIEIIYKGQHNHEPPPPHRRAKESSNDLNGHNAMPLTKSEPDRSGQIGNSSWSNETVCDQLVLGKDLESSQLTSLHPTKPNNTEEMEDNGPRCEKVEKGDEPNLKRRNTGESESVPSHKTVTEARIIVQTRSEVDLLDDGYKWRKYGQKVVKGNPHPRSYYKCTSPGCPVRKHIERAATDPKAVITTYEGKHNHDVPAGRHSSHNLASNNASNLKSQKVVAVLQLKEEIKL